MLSRRPALRPARQHLAHLLFPVVDVGRALRDQRPVCAGRQRRHQGQVAGAASHHLHHEGALVAGGRAADGVDGLGDAVQRRVGADGDVGAPHVVVDGADETGNRQMRVFGNLLGRDLALLLQLLQNPRPLGPQDVRAGEAPVAADHHQPVDAELQHVAHGLHTPLPRAKGRTPGGADDGATLLQNATHGVPAHGVDEIAPTHETLIPFVDRVHLRTPVQPGADDGAERRVHPRCVTPACQHANALHKLARPFLVSENTIQCDYST